MDMMSGLYRSQQLVEKKYLGKLGVYDVRHLPRHSQIPGQSIDICSNIVWGAST